DRQAGRARATGAGESDHSRAAQNLRYVLQLLLATQEAGELHRQLARSWAVGPGSCEQLAVQRAGDLVGLRLEPAAELGTQHLELLQRVLTAARTRVTAHQVAVCGLVQ